MKLIDCPSCKKQVSNKAQFCPGCGHKFYNSFGRFLKAMLLLGFCFIVFCIFIGGIINSTNSTPPTSTASSSTPEPAAIAAKAQSKKALPGEDKAYVAASLAYLNDANTAGTKLAKVWAGATDGTSSLEDCHQASIQAVKYENLRYQVYVTNRGSIPPPFKHVNNEITEIHNETLASLGKILSYWHDGGPANLQQGVDDFGKMVILMNSTIIEGRTTMESEAR